MLTFTAFVLLLMITVFSARPAVGKLFLKDNSKYFRLWEPRDKSKDIT